MTQDYKHPIAPPEEVVEQWLAQPEYVAGGNGRCKLISVTDHRLSSICAKAAQWGADQELEACCEVLNGFNRSACEVLRAARRPKPPSLKEEALKALNDAVKMADDAPPEGIRSDQADIICRALESIPDPS